MMASLFIAFLSFHFGFLIHAAFSYEKVMAGEELFSDLERRIFCEDSSLDEADYKRYERLKHLYREC